MRDTQVNEHLNTDQAAHYLGKSKSTLEWYRCEGRGPVYYKPGGRVFYKKSDLDAYMETGRVDPVRA